MTEEREDLALSELWDDTPEIREPLKDSPGIAVLIPRYHQVMQDGTTEEIIELYRINDHEIAWLEYKGRILVDITGRGREGEEFTGRELKCECDFTEGIGWKFHEGRPVNIYDDKICGPVEVLLRQRREQLRAEYLERFKDAESPELLDHLEEIIFDLIQRRRNGEFLEGTTGAEFWGGYFYAQTLMEIVGAEGRPFWDKLQALRDDKKIDLEGAVIQEYQTPPSPVWQEYIRLELDGYTAIAYLPTHSKMQQSWAIELTGPDGQRLEPSLGPTLGHIPYFGPDIDDVEEIKGALKEVLKSAKTALPTERPPLLIPSSEEE